MSVKRLVYPLLFAAFPVLTLYGENIGEMPVTDLVGPLAFVLGIAALLLVLLTVVTRNVEKTGIAVTALALFSFFYTATFHAVQSIFKPLGLAHLVKNRTFFPLWVLLLLLVVVLLLRTRRGLRTLARTLSVAGFVVIALAVFRIGAFLIAHPEVAKANYDAMTRSTHAEFGQPVELRLPTDPPDIYYLIFDRYPNASVLQDFYHFDNSPFINQLRERGFRASDSSVANYPMTYLSLASSLNMSYLGSVHQGRLHYTGLMRRNLVVETLKQAGYRYIHFGSWYEPTRTSPSADRNINDPLMLSEIRDKPPLDDALPSDPSMR